MWFINYQNNRSSNLKLEHVFLSDQGQGYGDEKLLHLQQYTKTQLYM